MAAVTERGGLFGESRNNHPPSRLATAPHSIRWQARQAAHICTQALNGTASYARNDIVSATKHAKSVNTTSPCGNRTRANCVLIARSSAHAIPRTESLTRSSRRAPTRPWHRKVPAAKTEGSINRTIPSPLHVAAKPSEMFRPIATVWPMQTAPNQCPPQHQQTAGTDWRLRLEGFRSAPLTTGHAHETPSAALNATIRGPCGLRRNGSTVAAKQGMPRGRQNKSPCKSARLNRAPDIRHTRRGRRESNAAATFPNPTGQDHRGSKHSTAFDGLATERARLENGHDFETSVDSGFWGMAQCPRNA